MKKIIIICISFLLGMTAGYFCFRITNNKVEEKQVMEGYNIVSENKDDLENELETLRKELADISTRKTEIESKIVILIEEISKSADAKKIEELKEFEEIIDEKQERSSKDDIEELKKIENASEEEKAEMMKEIEAKEEFLKNEKNKAEN